MQKEVLVQKLALSAVVFTVFVAGSAASFATTIPLTDSGILQISNMAGVLVGTTSSPTMCINWGGGSTCVPGTTHGIAVSGSSALFSAPSTGTIKDVTGFPPPTVTDFETVSGAGALAGQTVQFDLTSFVLTNGGAGFGNCASDAANNSCSPAGSPFVLAEDPLGKQVTVSFATLMSAYTGTSGTGTTPYEGLFTTQLSGTISGFGACGVAGLTANITNILSCEAAGGTITSTWSATESPIPPSTVPEPKSTVLLLTGGLLGLAVYRRRFRRT